MEKWNNSIALVIEAASGVGTEICRLLVKYPITVIGMDENIEKIRDVAREEAVVNAPGRLIGYKCNLLNEPEILLVFEKIREDFGQIDICIHIACFEYNPPRTDGTAEDRWVTIGVDFAHFAICARESLKLIAEKSMGQIIYISSMEGHLTTSSTLCDFYGVVEFIVKILSARLRNALSRFHSPIRAACISPFKIKTASERKRTEDRGSLLPAGVAQSVLYVLSTNYVLPTNPRVVDNDIPVPPVEQNL